MMIDMVEKFTSVLDPLVSTKARPLIYTIGAVASSCLALLSGIYAQWPSMICSFTATLIFISKVLQEQDIWKTELEFAKKIDHPEAHKWFEEATNHNNQALIKLAELTDDWHCQKKLLNLACREGVKGLESKLNHLAKIDSAIAFLRVVISMQLRQGCAWTQEKKVKKLSKAFNSLAKSAMAEMSPHTFDKFLRYALHSPDGHNITLKDIKTCVQKNPGKFSSLRAKFYSNDV